MSQLLRYAFCGIGGNELEGLALIAQEQKSLFLHWLTLHHLFSYHIYWCGDTQEGHPGCCSALYDSPPLLQSGLYSGTHICTHKTDASPSSTSLGNIPGKLLCYALGGIQSKGQIKQRSWWGGTKSLGCHHLHPTSVVEPGGTSKTPALVWDRLSLTREGKLQWRVLYILPSRAGKDASGGRKPWLWMPLLFSYRWELAIPEPLL